MKRVCRWSVRTACGSGRLNVHWKATLRKLQPPATTGGSDLMTLRPEFLHSLYRSVGRVVSNCDISITILVLFRPTLEGTVLTCPTISTS